MVYRWCTMTERNRPKMVRVSARAHALAAACDPEKNRGRGIERALEVLAAMASYEKGEVCAFGRGPMTDEATGEVFAFVNMIRDEHYERAIERAIVAYENRRKAASARDADALAAGSGDPDGRESADVS